MCVIASGCWIVSFFRVPSIESLLQCRSVLYTFTTPLHFSLVRIFNELDSREQLPEIAFTLVCAAGYINARAAHVSDKLTRTNKHHFFFGLYTQRIVLTPSRVRVCSTRISSPIVYLKFDRHVLLQHIVLAYERVHVKSR